MPPCPRRSTILTLLLALTASAADYPELARRAWGELQSGRAEQAYEMTRSVYRADPAVAAVHLAAAKRHVHPLRVVPICQELIPLAIRHWSDSNEILRTCGWHLVATRTHQSLAAQAAARLVQAGPYDDDARGLRLAVADMRELPRRPW